MIRVILSRLTWLLLGGAMVEWRQARKAPAEPEPGVELVPTDVLETLIEALPWAGDGQFDPIESSARYAAEFWIENRG